MTAGSGLALVVIPVLLVASALDAGAPGALSYRWIPLAAAVGSVAALALGPGRVRRRLARALLPLLPVLALGTLYVINPTHRWVDGVGLLPASPWRGWPGSAHAPSSFAALGVGVAAAGLFGLGRVLDATGRRIAHIGIAAVGAAMAAVAIHQRLVPRADAIYEFTGVFANRNHFVAFALLLLPATLALAHRFHYRAIESGAPSSPSGVVYLCAALLAAGIVLTESRAGVVLLAASLAAWAAVRWRLHLHYGHWRPARWLRGGVPVALLLAAAIAVPCLAMATRHGRGWPGSGDVEFRGRVVRDTLAAWRDNFAWGTGPGTFAVIYPYYQSEDLRDFQFGHAHFEPAQFLAEFGLLGGAIVLVGIVLALRGARRAAPGGEARPTPGEIEGPGIAIGLVSVLLLGLSDFPFRAPTVLLLSAFMASQLCAAWPRPRTPSATEVPPTAD